MTNLNKHIRVAVDIRDLQISASGTRIFLKELTKEFQNTDRNFSFYFLDSSTKVYTGKNIWGKIREQLKYLYWKQIKLPLKVRKLKCDILFCSDFMTPFFQWGFKTVPVFHDAFFWEYPQHYNRFWLSIFRRLSVAGAKKAFCIATPTEFSKKKIAEHTGFSLQRIRTIGSARNPVSTISSMDIDCKPYLLHVGTFEKRKNITALIKAFKLIRDKGHDINLVLVGKASNKQKLDDSKNIDTLIKELNLDQYVFRTGYISDEKVAAYYKNAFAYVFPSINEGFGIPVFESFYYKIPVLIANNSSLPEIAGNAALSFNPFDINDISNTITSVIVNESLRKELIEKGNLQLDTYTWNKTAHQLMDIFNDAMK